MRVLAGRPAAVIATVAGLAAVAAGAVGLTLTRAPDRPVWPAAAVLPTPTGPIAAAPRPNAPQVALPVALTIPAIGVQTQLIRLGLTAAGALQVPPTPFDRRLVHGQPAPWRRRLGGYRRSHRLVCRAGGFLRAFPAAAR